MTEQERLSGEQIADRLAADGWSIESKTVNPGGYDESSEFRVTVKRAGQSLTTSYSKGSGLRRWKESRFGNTSTSGYWAGKKRAGQRVEFALTPKLKRGVERNEEIIADFNRLTQAEPVTLDEVIYSLNSDASAVRFGQTFEEFCGEFGYDTDSRKAEGIFNTCREIWAGLVRLGADFDKLDELFHDY